MSTRLRIGQEYQFDIYRDGIRLAIDLFSLESTDPTILSVTETGVMLPLRQGNASITAVKKEDDTITFVQDYEIDVVDQNLTGVARIVDPEDTQLPYLPIKLTSGEQLQYLIYDQGILLPPTDFTYESSDPLVFTIDESGAIEGGDEGTAILVATRSDGIEIRDIVVVGSSDRDFHQLALKKNTSPLRSSFPPIGLTVEKETNNTHTRLVRYENILVGDCILFAGRVKTPGSNLPQWKFALWREVTGYGRIVAESPWFNKWPEGQMLTFIHPLVGLLEFIVEEEAVVNGQDIIKLRDLTSTVLPTVNPSTSLEAAGVIVWDPSEILRSEAVYKPREEWTEQERLIFINTGKRPLSSS